MKVIVIDNCDIDRYKGYNAYRLASYNNVYNKYIIYIIVMCYNRYKL